MTTLYLIRHGETDWNEEGRWQGQADVPLNERGCQQAANLAQMLLFEGLEAIYSSDLARARQTAEILACTTGLALCLDPRLREIHQGEWQGLLVTEIQKRYADAFAARKADPLGISPPGGETTRQVQKRVIQAVKEIVSRHPDGLVAIVSHGFAIAIILAYLKGVSITQVWDLVPPNGTVRQLEVADHTDLD